LEVKNFSELDAKLIFKQMVQAVVYLHSKKIVHRDIKLENFLFFDQSQNSTIKLIDFGVSRLLEKLGKSKFKKMVTLIGTPEYMSPELIKGR